MAEKILKGRDFILMAERDGAMVPVCCSRDLNISTSAELIEATKAPQSVWKSYLPGPLGYTISSSGLISVSEGFGINDLYDIQFGRIPMSFFVREGVGDDYFLSGSVYITSVDVVGSHKDMMIMSFSATGDGLLVRTKTLQTFPLVDGEGNTIVDGEGNTVVVAPDQYGTETPIDVSVDC